MALGADGNVDIEPVVAGELLEIALPVRDQADRQAVTPQDAEGRKDVVVEIEVGVDLPSRHHVHRTRPCALDSASHPPDDVLGEGDPDLLVVDELGVGPEILEGGETGLLVAARVEHQAVLGPTRW